MGIRAQALAQILAEKDSKVLAALFRNSYYSIELVSSNKGTMHAIGSRHLESFHQVPGFNISMEHINVSTQYAATAPHPPFLPTSILSWEHSMMNRSINDLFPSFRRLLGCMH